ncbi:hypothetical protein [uncultured Acetobacteroides sp.]|uniref:hypothetical protein n=1 Tax=uncultured Acetobacteroides sp. TaxID=1760811 RepID=UPI0029F53BFE|nr:hypothetical protein [uncultured Acetobacteroides sp.]
MKKKLFLLMLGFSISYSINAQTIFIPNGTNGIGNTAKDVGIGTSSPSNIQGWGTVLDVRGSDHSKILTTNSANDLKMGIFNHTSWYGGGGFVGTESNHNLFFLTNYNVKMTILTNGFVGIGTSSPNSMLHIKTPNYTTKGIIIESDNAKLEYGNHAITLSSKPTWSNVPYIEWNNPQGLRQAYLGWDPSVFNLTLENGYNFSINGGNVLIGKPTQVNPAYKLNVAGKVRADEITVNTSGADFVFENGYNLRPLTEVEAYVKENKHLPDVAPAAEMQNNGVSIGEMNTKLLQKVEELTLYLIDKDKKIKELEGRCSDYDSLKARVEKIENALSNK